MKGALPGFQLIEQAGVFLHVTDIAPTPQLLAAPEPVAMPEHAPMHGPTWASARQLHMELAHSWPLPASSSWACRALSFSTGGGQCIGAEVEGTAIYAFRLGQHEWKIMN